MGKKNKKSSSADDDSQIKKHKKSSTATTDVDTAHASSSKSLKSGKMVLKPCSQSKLNVKKHEEKSENNEEDEKIDQKYEIKELSKSVKELTEAMKKQQEILNELVSFMEKETPDIAEEPTPGCCFDCKEADGNNWQTILVKGFENLRPSNEIKKMLTRYFSSCGEVQRVFVPFECATRVPLGFAFINMKSGRSEALKLHGKFLQGRKLEVKDATKCGEYSGYTNFRGCRRCLKKRLARVRECGRDRFILKRARRPSQCSL